MGQSYRRNTPLVPTAGEPGPGTPAYQERTPDNHPPRNGVMAMGCNMSSTDRMLRILAGIALLALGWGGVVGGTLGTVFKWLGFVPLLTGLLTYCPVYSLFGYNGCKQAAP